MADQTFGEPSTMTEVSFSAAQKMAKAPARIASVNDIVGQYEYNCITNDGKQASLSPDIEAGLTATDIVIKYLPYSDVDIHASVSLADNKVTLSPEDTGIYQSNYGENMMVGPFKWVPSSEEGYMTFQALDKLELTIESDGTIVFPDIDGYPTGIAYYISQGYFNVFYGGNLERAKFKDINLNEWKDYGTGSYYDPVFNSLLIAAGQPEVPEFDVKVMVNRDNDSQYLIVDPYKGDRFDNDAMELYNLTPNATGYILIDATDPLCVLVQPLVGSGYGYDQGGVADELSVFNMEAMMVRNGYTTEDVYYEYGGNDEEASYMDEDTIYMLHIRFAFASSPLSIYGWNGIEMIPGTLTLDSAGVEGVEFDENAPVKYYNFQGVEIANPTKGQLVIKTQGSKAQKMIAK